jgi:hypothetical protein
LACAARIASELAAKSGERHPGARRDLVETDLFEASLGQQRHQCGDDLVAVGEGRIDGLRGTLARRSAGHDELPRV